MSEDFREYRQVKRKKKEDRSLKFSRAFPFIKEETKSIGWSLKNHRNEYWRFMHNDSLVELNWWPSSGKTNKGETFFTWPELKSHLESLAQSKEG